MVHDSNIDYSNLIFCVAASAGMVAFCVKNWISQRKEYQTIRDNLSEHLSEIDFYSVALANNSAPRNQTAISRLRAYLDSVRFSVNESALKLKDGLYERDFRKSLEPVFTVKIQSIEKQLSSNN